MGRILITSRLGEKYREDLEHILFFNPRQSIAEAGIRRCIERFGMPEITTENHRLRVMLNRQSMAQTLFSLDHTKSTDILAGVLVYIRDSAASLAVLHVAVAQPYLQQGTIASASLAWGMLHQVIESASRISGINHINLVYDHCSHRGRKHTGSIAVSRKAVKGTPLPVIQVGTPPGSSEVLPRPTPCDGRSIARIRVCPQTPSRYAERPPDTAAQNQE